MTLLSDTREERSRQYSEVARSLQPSDWVLRGADPDIHEVRDTGAEDRA